MRPLFFAFGLFLALFGTASAYLQPTSGSLPVNPDINKGPMSTYANGNDALSNGNPNGNGNDTTAGNPASQAPVEIEPPPLLINGKPDTDMTDDEKRAFLQGKVRTISQQDGQVELLHVAPGYPVSIRFSDPIGDITIGDKKLVSVSKHGKNLVFNALATTGDTPVQVFFSGNRMRMYHVFACDNFVTGDSFITVRPFGPDVHTTGYQSNASRKDLHDLIQIISNYDALLQEGALDPQNISREPIFRENKSTGYVVFHLYRIHGAMALTFAFRNLMHYRVRLDESRLRVSIGNSFFIPDYVSFHDVELEPGAITTGVLILFKPTFDPHQPLEIIWK